MVKLTWSQYTQMWDTINDFTKLKGRQPNYVDKFGYRFQKIAYKTAYDNVVKFRKENKRNPNTVEIVGISLNSNGTTVTSTTNSNGWILTGLYTPDYQDTDHTCGPSSEQMVFSALGKTVKEAYIAQLAGTTNSGTAHEGLINAAKKIDSSIKAAEYYFSDLGLDGLASKLKGNAEFIIHIRTGSLKTDADGKECWKNDYGHYIYLVGVNPSKNLVRVFDPTKGLRNFTSEQIKAATAAVTNQKSFIMFYK